MVRRGGCAGEVAPGVTPRPHCARRVEAALALGARRRPLELPPPGPERPDARRDVTGSPRPAAASRRNRRAGAPPRVLRPADRGEARTTAGADDHQDALRARW